MPKPSSQDALLETARASAARGNASAARAAYRHALGQASDDADLMIEFAIFEAGKNRLESATNLLMKARRLRPDDASIALNIGEMARLGGDHALAANEFARALELTPDDADAAFGLGEALLRLGRASESIIVLGRATGLSPQDVEIRLVLGEALRVSGQIETASNAYRTATELNPGLASGWIGLGRCLYDLNRFDAAADALSHADAIDPLGPALLCRLSRALLNSGHPQAALDTAQRVTAPSSKLSEALHLAGMCLQNLGRFDDAEAALRRAFEIDRDRTGAIEALAAMGRARPGDVQALEVRRAAASGLPDQVRASACFALYRIHDRAEKRDEAFAALSEANTIKASLEPFDAARHTDTVAAMMAAFDASFFAGREPVAWRPDFTPIFIIGMPRSGTTLAEQILAHYAGVHAGGERIPFAEALGEALDHPSSVARRDQAWAEGQARLVADRLARGRESEDIVTDKTPGNYMAVPLISWMFPGARIIHCRRDPRDTGFSCFEQNFRAGVSFAYRLDAFACAWRCYDRICRHWRDAGAPEMFELEYEALVSDPAVVARQMIDYCGLEWDPRCLDTASRQNAVQTASFWQVRQPINDRSVGKWRRYERQLGPLLAGLPPSSPPVHRVSPAPST